MFRVTQNVRSRVRDVADSIRFMSKQDRRKIYYCFAGLTSLTTTGLYAAFHTSHIDFAFQQLQMYQMKMGVPVHIHLFDHLQTVLDDMNVSIQNSSLSLFNFVGNDVYSLGCLSLPTGALIGIPFNFNVNKIEQLKTEDLRLLGRFKTKRSVNSPTIKQLFNALILSDDAKKFALAHQISLLKSSYFFVKSFNIFACSLGAFFLTSLVNKKFIPNVKKQLPKVLSGVLCFFTMMTVCLAVDQLLDEAYDLRALRSTLRQCPKLEYRTGGMEFYQKLIERNKAIRDLLDTHGDNYYTADGKVKKLFGLMKQSYEPHLVILASEMQNHKI